MADMHVDRGRSPGLPHPAHRNGCYRPVAPVADSYSYGHSAFGCSPEVDKVLVLAQLFFPVHVSAVLAFDYGRRTETPWICWTQQVEHSQNAVYPWSIGPHEQIRLVLVE